MPLTDSPVISKSLRFKLITCSFVQRAYSFIAFSCRPPRHGLVELNPEKRGNKFYGYERLTSEAPSGLAPAVQFPIKKASITPRPSVALLVSAAQPGDYTIVRGRRGGGGRSLSRLNPRAPLPAAALLRTSPLPELQRNASGVVGASV